MESNGLLDQISEAVWDGVGMPKSVIRGATEGSYASELVVASGASMFVEQIANKIGKVVLDNMRERLMKVNPQYPVNHLNVKIAFEIAQSRIEQMKNMQLMKEVGQFTSTELREEIGKPALTEEQINSEGVITAGNVTIIKGMQAYEQQGVSQQQDTSATNKLRPTSGAKGVRGDGSVGYPTTAKSAGTQGTDSGDAVSENVLYKGQD